MTGPGLRLLGSALVALTLSLPQPAQGQAGRVSGTVWDSIAGAPLSDAAVFLWETPWRAVTDPTGNFTIEGVPDGTYSILFFHTRLGELGVSPGPARLTITAGRQVNVQLAIPSMATVVGSQCLMDDRPPRSGAVAGRVLDAESSLPLGGATVHLSWQENQNPTPHSLDLRTDNTGWFRSCAVPADIPVLLSADFIGRQSVRREFTVASDGFADGSVEVASIASTRISGRLVDAETDQPIEGAETWLRGTNHRTLSGPNGQFLMERVPPGTYMMMTDHLAYGTKMDTLTVPGGQRLTVEMRLDDRPIEIAPITVVAEGTPIERARRRGGIVVTKEQIDGVRQNSRDASDVLRSLHIPGIIVRHQSNGVICVGYSTGQVKMNQTGCVEMMIFINDVRATDADMALRLPPDAIERMVIYKPVEAGNLFGLGAGNGVWMIYTHGN